MKKPDAQPRMNVVWRRIIRGDGTMFKDSGGDVRRLIVLVISTIAASVFCVIGASAEPLGPPPAGKARIVVFRPDSFGGSIGRSWPVKLDGQALGDVKAGSFVYADRAPGRHILSLEMFDFPGVSRQSISVAAGSTYYFRVKLKDKSEKTLSAGASGGILGWAVAAGAAGKAEPDGVFEFVVIGDGKKAISDLRNASK
jgi:hypothetical protein